MPITRRHFVSSAAAFLIQDKDRPALPCGIASGDVTAESAVIWSRCDRPAQMIVEWDTSDSFRNARRVPGPAALESSDFTTKIELAGLPAGEIIFYRVRYEDLANPRVSSEPAAGRFRTAPAAPRDVSFVFSADTGGQGFGINRDWGGMRLYETMRRARPDLFIHCGDLIYADNPMPAEVRLDDGTVWKNVVTEAKSKVAETLQEYRGNFAYNLLDENLRRFNAEVPQVVQWDDHETRNNWYPGQIIEDPRYQVKSASLLAARGRRAFFEYTPIRSSLRDPERIYRSFRYGPLLDLFLLDERTYRGPNTANRQAAAGGETAFLGRGQLDWLKQALRASRATWKVISSDMPIGITVRDGPDRFEAVANGDGPALGRELEIAELLRFLKASRIRNVVWITGDIHYCAAHYYDPARAQFTGFDPFWEFVAGPIHAGTFGPGRLDNTFGPQLKFLGIPPGMKGNRPPSDGLQFFGQIRIDARTRALTSSLHDLEGKQIYSVELEPPGAAGRARNLRRL